MRYIPRNCIRPNAILAMPILGSGGEKLLGAGVEMRTGYIRRMEMLGIPGAYVEDPFSEDLQIVGVLSDELKMKAVRSISSVFSQAAKAGEAAHIAPGEVMAVAEQIVEEILGHGDVMLNLFDMKVYDSYTYYHCVSVTVHTVVLGLGMGFSKSLLVKMAYAALLHDIGKVFVDPAIINKPGPLTPAEYARVQGHPRIGYDFVREKFTSITEVSALGILEHHERIDGQGYPEGRAGGDISLAGRLIAIADVYDALVSDRPYRPGIFPVEAMEYVLGNCGGQFDEHLVQVFNRKVAIFPVGSCVLLSNGYTALVMENFEGMTQRPLVKLIMKDDVVVDPELVNLSKEAFDVTVVAIQEM